MRTYRIERTISRKRYSLMAERVAFECREICLPDDLAKFFKTDTLFQARDGRPVVTTDEQDDVVKLRARPVPLCAKGQGRIKIDSERGDPSKGEDTKVGTLAFEKSAGFRRLPTRVDLFSMNENEVIKALWDFVRQEQNINDERQRYAVRKQREHDIVAWVLSLPETGPMGPAQRLGTYYVFTTDVVRAVGGKLFSLGSGWEGFADKFFGEAYDAARKQ